MVLLLDRSSIMRRFLFLSKSQLFHNESISFIKSSNSKNFLSDSRIQFHTFLKDQTLNSSESKSSDSSLQVQSENSVVFKKKIPKNFVADTYLPHLENQIAEHSYSLMPSQLVPLICAYSKLPYELRHKTLAKKLSDQVKFRISGFRASECIEILYPMFKMLPDDSVLFQDIATHLSLPHNFSEIQTLQLIGVIRVYAKIRPKFDEFLEKIVPRLKQELSNYDTTELTDILSSIAEHSRHSEASNDIELLSILLPEIERKYNQTSLLHSITNLASLCKLKIYHEAFIKRLTKDITEPLRIRNLPPKYISKICWIYSKFGILDSISKVLFPLIENNIDRFDSKDYAKISQSLPEDSFIPLKICNYLSTNLTNLSRSEFLAFFLGCIRRNFFPLEDGSNPEVSFPEINDEEKLSLIIDLDRKSLLNKCLGYISIEQVNFTERELEKLILLLIYTPNYQYILRKLPSNFYEIINEYLSSLNVNFTI